ncbi:hypothetical protein theurythT_08970 [Thalassotalea eurytherma]|uniref:Uncharacterized protein n=1 Tax=Thalassotalea eurytherma TaxID=1144278 RepID=A0ABQ6H3W4_9GAMM|nr:hypothetical protein theurythT_08970 [Thalassotalea eurytherma]
MIFNNKNEIEKFKKEIVIIKEQNLALSDDMPATSVRFNKQE